MPGLTPTRVRLTLSQKVKIIEESKKSDFSRKKICEEYSISKATISSILKDQKTHLENYDSGIPGKHKTMRKPDFPEIESTLYEWFTKMTRLNVPVSGPMLIGKAKKLHTVSIIKIIDSGNSENLSLVNKNGDKTKFTITRVHCT